MGWHGNAMPAGAQVLGQQAAQWQRLSGTSTSKWSYAVILLLTQPCNIAAGLLQFAAWWHPVCVRRLAAHTCLRGRTAPLSAL